MASLKFSLGMIPSTAKIEQQEKALAEEYEKLLAFTESAELARYTELEALVTSASFKQEQARISGFTYKGSPEYTREKEYENLVRSKEIKSYFRTKDSDALKKFLELDGSDKIKSYEELEKFINSSSFRDKKKQTKSNLFRETEEYARLQEYLKLKGAADIKDYYKFRKSKDLANFRKVDGSTMLAKYEELKEFLATDEFKTKKEYLLDSKRFEKTEMFAQLKEYETLKKSSDIIWYFKTKDSDKFDSLKKRELIFSEEFDKPSLDSKKWLTNYYWGDKLLKDRYSHETDLHFHTESGNFDIRNSALIITTKPQKTEGKVWSPKSGFVKKEFTYTSGQINTGNSFRQQCGIFSAKIKLDNPMAKNAFWLLGDKMVPHIDICRTGKGKIWFDIFRSEKSVARTSIPGKYARDFYIFTLEWKPEKLVWKVNGEEVMTQTGNIPQEPMYLSLAGGVDTPLNTVSNMEIDWIRVYKTV